MPVTPPDQRKRRRVRIRVIVAAVVVLLAGWTAWELFVAVSAARAAETTLRSAVESARAGDLAAAQRQLTGAGADLSRSADAAASPPVRVLSWLPVLGPNIDALREGTRAGDLLVNDAAVPLLDAVDRLRAAQRSAPAGQLNVDAIAAEQGTVASAAAAVHAASAGVQQIEPSELFAYREEFASLQDALATADESVAEVSRLTAHLPALLGADGPKTYLLAFQNQGEERPTGGLIGSWGTITVDHGQIALSETGSNDDFGQMSIAMPEGIDDAKTLYGDDLTLIYNINLSPDFPVAGKILSAVWESAGKARPDGVIAITPRTMAAILSVTGPLTVPGGPELSADNAEHYLQAGIYEDYPNGDRARNDYLNLVTKAIFATAMLQGFGSDALLTALVDTARSGDIKIWLADPEAQAALATFSVSGALPPPAGQDVRFYLTNSDGSKLGEYVRPTVVTTCAADGPELSLSFEYTPPSRVDSYALGTAGARTPATLHTVLLSLYVPPSRGIDRVSVNGQQVQLAVGTERGWNVARVPLEFQPGSTTSVVAELTGDRSRPGVRTQPLRHPTSLPASEPCS